MVIQDQYFLKNIWHQFKGLNAGRIGFCSSTFVPKYNKKCIFNFPDQPENMEVPLLVLKSYHTCYNDDSTLNIKIRYILRYTQCVL